MTNKNLVFKPKSKKLTEKKDTASFTLHCYPSDDTRINQIYVDVDDFLFLYLAYGIVINQTGLDMYEGDSLKKEDWLKLLNEARKLARFDTFQNMYDYVQQKKIEIDRFYYNLEENSEYIWNECEEINIMLDDLFAWTEFVMKDGDEIEILGL